MLELLTWEVKSLEAQLQADPVMPVHQLRCYNNSAPEHCHMHMSTLLQQTVYLERVNLLLHLRILALRTLCCALSI